MERASVTRLYKDSSSQKTIMLLETKANGERFKVTLPSQKAGILALEGHGLNDRCPLYRVLSECVRELGGAFGSVVVRLDEVEGVSGRIAVSRGEQIVSWISGDVVELVAFALHVQLPIYVSKQDPLDGDDETALAESMSLPSVFEEALSDILDSGPGASPPFAD